jgi:hypothetical protein
MTRIGSQNGPGDQVGSAMVESGYASLYASEICKYADHNELPVGSLMAYAMTHEIGHLLLGVNHEPTGIMRAVWGKTELSEIARGSLRFSTGEPQALRLVPARGCATWKWLITIHNQAIRRAAQ